MCIHIYTMYMYIYIIKIKEKEQGALQDEERKVQEENYAKIISKNIIKIFDIVKTNIRENDSEVFLTRKINLGL